MMKAIQTCISCCPPGGRRFPQPGVHPVRRGHGLQGTMALATRDPRKRER